MPRKRSKKKASNKKRSKRTIKSKRPYKLGKRPRAQRRYRKRRHRASRVAGHHGRAREEAELTNYLLHQLLKTAASTDEDPYHYEPRHWSRDPEYEFSSDRVQEFKRGFAAPDVSFLRPQGPHLPPHRGNFPG